MTAEQTIIQYVVCICNEQDNDFVMNVTYDGVLSILQRALASEE